MSSGHTKGTPASSQIIWLEEKVKEQEQNIDTIMQINARLRDEKREANAEIKRLREALSKVDKALQVEAAEYVPAIQDAFDIIDTALQQKDSE